MPEYLLRNISDLKDGEMKVVPAGKVKVLIVCHQGRLKAFQDTCPHAGGPLAEGAICNGRLVCPWHMGTFRLSDGKLIEPPPMDSLKTFPIRKKDGNLFIEVPGHSPQDEGEAVDRSRDQRTFVIVGAGAAGSMAAKTLRTEGYCGRIVLVDPHAEEPIDRTMLTKMALTDSSPLNCLELRSLEHLNVETIKSPVVSLRSTQRDIKLRNGKTIRFDAALIATGGKPKVLPMQQESAVYTIRHAEDLRRLRVVAKKNNHAVIVGTSFIGMEAASALKQRGLKVTVIGQASLPFEEQFGERIANALLSLHKRKGVKFELAAKLIQVAPRYVTIEQDGYMKKIEGDFVILGIGVLPNLDFEHDLPLAADGGLLADHRLCVKSKIWAAGDVVNIQGVRIEHWRVAQQQGMHAAKQMLGLPSRYDVVPFFWTYHFGKRINYLGHAKDWDDIWIMGEPRRLKFLAAMNKGGRVKAIVSCGYESETALLAELLREPLSTNEARTAVSRLARARSTS